ncbi:MAG TPA: Tn3 family transposase, partial [Ktedonobacterales bacterium]
MRASRRAATLLALVRTLEVTAHDDALDILDLLLADLFAKAERVGKQERLRTLGDLDEAALTLAEATARLLSPKGGKALMAAYLGKQRTTLEAAITRVRELARPVDTHYEEELLARYTAVRRFLPSVLRTIAFAGAPAGRPVLEALAFLSGLEGQKRPSMQEAPLACVPARWRRYVAPKGGSIDRKAYTLCVVEQLREALHRRTLFVKASGRWADPRARLLAGSTWEAVKPAVCQTLGRSSTPEPDLAAWAQELDT